MNTKQTALLEEHIRLKAKIVDFAGWSMPLSYTSVLDEHKNVREACGIFDVSHMGQITVKGNQAAECVQYLTINDSGRLNPGDSQYSAILNHDGGFVDDIFVYRLADESFLLCVNASNIEKDYNWILEQSKNFDVNISNESEKWSQIAIQGPNSRKAICALLDSHDKGRCEALEFTQHIYVTLFGEQALLARTGYTGELGFELYIPNSIAVDCWRALINTQKDTGLLPIGLGARDTLRLEACYLLYGNDMNETVSPLEAGVSWATKLDCGDFVGRNTIVKQKETGVPRAMYAFILEDKAIPRHDMDVLFEGEKIGVVTSGSVLPTVGGAGGLALLKSGTVKVGSKISIDVRGKQKVACIVKRPLYSAKVKD